MAALLVRLRLPALLIVASMLSTGCSLLALPYFLMCGEPTQQPKLLKLAGKDSKKEIKVVLLAYAPLDGRPELVGVDRELCKKLARHLQLGFKENKEKVTIVTPKDVEKFKDDHPDWHALDLQDIGEHFDADYVVFLEVESLSLYEHNTGSLMYRGRTEIAISVFDMNEPDHDPLTDSYSCEYPTNSRGPMPSDDQRPELFRQAFLDFVAKRLSWYFTAHSLGAEFSCE